MRSTLFQFLSDTPPESMTSGTEFLQLLASEWHTFQGSDQGGMEAYKLHRGLEDINWIPPILSFCIERHGSFMLGSKSAEIQRWELNLQSRVASMHIERHRRLIPAEKNPDLTLIVRTVVNAVLGKNDVPS